MARARWAENLVAEWCRRNGYTILARNWTVRGGELDIVAYRDGTVVVCEVKARATAAFGDPLEAMTELKIARVRRAGHEYVRRETNGRVRVRFDMASVLGTELTVHIDAF